MAINFNQPTQKKKYPKKIIIMIAILIFGCALLVWSLMRSKPEEAPILNYTNSSILKRFDINFEILKNPIFIELKDFQKINPINPINPIENVGRENPFKFYSR